VTFSASTPSSFTMISFTRDSMLSAMLRLVGVEG
jgi:hypothetical protein